MATTLYEFNELAGCVVQRKSQRTGQLVGLYDAEQAGMDPAGGAWLTVCEPHGSLCNHRTLALARHHLADPTMWCDTCRALHPAGHGDEPA